jgi:hypothetical protein
MIVFVAISGGFFVAKSVSDRAALAAWKRIEALGGHGVWEADTVIVSLANTAIEDEDLALFHDFPYVQMLDLSHTTIGDASLAHLHVLRSLEHLIVVDTNISTLELDKFRHDHPSVKITTMSPPKGTINPFTGKPI